MKISKESLEKLGLDVQNAAIENTGIQGVIDNTLSLSIGDIRVCKDFLAIAKMTISFDIAVSPGVIESSDPCKIVTAEELL